MQQTAYIAFQGGAALGIAHLGAWRAVAHHYRITGVVGSSTGSVVATLCAAGYSPELALRVFRNLAWPDAANKYGLLGLLMRRNTLASSDRFQHWMERSLADHLAIKGQFTFAQLYRMTGIYLAVVACQLDGEQAQPVIFDHQSAADLPVALAVRASITVPGLFVPVPHLPQWPHLVDGGLLPYVPIEMLHTKAQAGNNPLIGIHFNRAIDYLEVPQTNETFRRGAARVLSWANQLPENIMRDPSYIDVAIDIQGFKSLDFHLSEPQKDELLHRGERAAQQALSTYRERVQVVSSDTALDISLNDPRTSNENQNRRGAVPGMSLLSPQRSNPSNEQWRHHAIVDHDQVFGIRTLLDKLAKELAATDRSWIISLFGQGGVGKTTAAYELVRLHARPAGFARIAWVSAKSMYFSASSGLRREDDAAFYWSDLLKRIADQLGLDIGLSRAVWRRTFADSIRALPASEKCLIVIDNFETVQDAEVAKQYLESENIDKPHKFIITTRDSIKSTNSTSIPIMEQNIKGITLLQDACDFIRYLGRGDDDIENAPNSSFDNIIELTEGNPFLIKLIVTRIKERHLPPEVVLRDLKQRHNLGGAVQYYLYTQSLADLERESGVDNARRLMSVFCTRLPGDAFSFDEIIAIGGFDDDYVFRTTLQKACNLALIRTHDLNHKYSIHSLLWQFTCRSSSDMSEV